VRDNGRPVLVASSLTPNMLSLQRGERPMVACPECGRWRVLHRGMLAPHRAGDGVSRCPGSAWRVDLDLTCGEWLARLGTACRDASGRRGSRAPRRAVPAVPPPVHRIASMR
jgi:hypothetical protein